MRDDNPLQVFAAYLGDLRVKPVFTVSDSLA